MKSNSYIPASAQFALDAASEAIHGAYDSYGVFLVGSCLERKDFRDVDVRCILADDEFEALFPKDETQVLRPRWQVQCLALSAWLRSMTGLPIDFQFQKISVANERFKGARRVSLGRYCFSGDATT